LLALTAKLQVAFVPFLNGTGVFSEHAFSRTGGIYDDDIESAFQMVKVCRIIVRDDYMGSSPFDHIFF
jgi:hypothetical protein